MKLVHPESLGATVDAINEAYFYGKEIPQADKKAAAMWIAGRQGLKWSYANMFAPTELDFKCGLTVFTGEKISTKAGSSHILGEEASRALILLGVKDPAVKKALKLATDGILARLSGPDREPGIFCCGICSASYWRHLAAGGLKNNEREISAGMKVLARHRDGTGRWRRFPFYYTLLALWEADTPAAKKEILYTAPVLERLLKRTPDAKKVYHKRRYDLVERIMAKI